MKKIKRWRVYQTISILVDAENEVEAKDKVLNVQINNESIIKDFNTKKNFNI